MSRRTKIILLVSFIIVIIILIALLLIRSRTPSPTGPVNRGVTNTQPSPLPSPMPPLTTPTNIEPPPQEPQEQNPEVVAADFTERFGSYSSESNFQNYRDLYPQMTEAMRLRTEESIAASDSSPGPFANVTTKALNTTVENRTDTAITVSVSTQRAEASDTNPQANVYYQTATLTLVKVDLRWLVDSFTWN